MISSLRMPKCLVISVLVSRVFVVHSSQGVPLWDACDRMQRHPTCLTGCTACLQVIEFESSPLLMVGHALGLRVSLIAYPVVSIKKVRIGRCRVDEPRKQ